MKQNMQVAFIQDGERKSIICEGFDYEYDNKKIIVYSCKDVFIVPDAIFDTAFVTNSQSETRGELEEQGIVCGDWNP